VLFLRPAGCRHIKGNSRNPHRLSGFRPAAIFVISLPFHRKVIPRASVQTELNVRQALFPSAPVMAVNLRVGVGIGSNAD
jgi:hypothetical protein